MHQNLGVRIKLSFFFIISYSISPDLKVGGGCFDKLKNVKSSKNLLVFDSIEDGCVKFSVRIDDWSSDDDSDDDGVNDENNKNYKVLGGVLSLFADKFSTLKELIIAHTYITLSQPHFKH